MTIWFVLGTAAELIKVYPLIHAASQRQVQWRVLSTGQSGQNFWHQFDHFGLSRQQTLNLMKTGGDLENPRQAGRWFLKALRTSPHRLQNEIRGKTWVVVHGDTLSTLIGSIWGRRLGLPIAHVEAGLRSKHWWQPFPEEISRRLVSHMASLHFTPDEVAFKNLFGAKGRVVNTQGNTLMDAIHLIAAAPQSQAQRPICVANLHRFENLNSSRRWKALIATTLKAAKTHEVHFVMHPQTEHKIRSSPADQERLNEAGVKLVPRMLFQDFIGLLKRADYVISDGGSNQEETFYLGVPCLILRETTERQEGLGSTALLSRFEVSRIEDFLNNPGSFRRPPFRGQSSPTQLIMDFLEAQNATT